VQRISENQKTNGNRRERSAKTGKRGSEKNYRGEGKDEGSSIACWHHETQSGTGTKSERKIGILRGKTGMVKENYRNPECQVSGTEDKNLGQSTAAGKSIVTLAPRQVAGGGQPPCQGRKKKKGGNRLKGEGGDGR